MIYFVSGHRNLTKEEFDQHYIPFIDFIISEDSYASFVVGDWEGCDFMFVQYMEAVYSDIPIVIFYVDIPRIKKGEFNRYRFRKCDNYDECDAAMTAYSHFDVTWIRPGREDSHTAKNIKRRYNLC